ACPILSQTCPDRCSRGSRCPVISNPRITPCRRAVPEVLDRWIVVDVQSVDQFLTTDRRLIRIADVGVVDTEMVVLGVIGHLHKTADMRCPSAGKEQRYVLRHFNAAILGARHWGLRRGR